MEITLTSPFSQTFSEERDLQYNLVRNEFMSL